jgi:hypothetical protein
MREPEQSMNAMVYMEIFCLKKKKCHKREVGVCVSLELELKKKKYEKGSLYSKKKKKVRKV